MRPLLCLLTVAIAASARDGYGSCRTEPCPFCRTTGGTAPDVFPWLESVERWETMFPTLRGLGMFLCHAGIDADQSGMIGDLVEECDRELAALESEIMPPGALEPFAEAFASAGFGALDIELAEDRVDEFEDEAIVVVSETVASIRDLLTDSQIAAAAEYLRHPPERPAHGHFGCRRAPGFHRSRGTGRSSER